MSQNTCKSGFNLIESAIVLAVIGLVIGGIWVAAGKVAYDRKINGLITDFGIIANNIKNAGGSTYWIGGAAGGLTYSITDTLSANHMLPQTWAYNTASSTYRDPYFNGIFYVQVGTSTNESVRFVLGYEFDTTMTEQFGLSECINLTTKIVTTFRSTAPTRATAPYSNYFRVINTAGDEFKGPLSSNLDPHTIAQNCTILGGVWGFYIYVPY